ncbi:hypothetical protein F383_26994 [Gossypium arboreum]|uniref:Uncharacterized protein n=1 Tax=Gossypium arboreum TaxID=29729 RepID=A0A0B0PAU6_GOSAR|nr:hypothetical protein F383_26994 [Gossypium arboreum]
MHRRLSLLGFWVWRICVWWNIWRNRCRRRSFPKKCAFESFKCRICKYTLQNLLYFSWKWKMSKVKFQDQSCGFS